jgi:hypothetical protein
VIFAGTDTQGRLEFLLKIKGVSRDILIKSEDVDSGNRDLKPGL